jgi:D-sedoheptulose 7-phosphate isomerase
MKTLITTTLEQSIQAKQNFARQSTDTIMELAEEIITSFNRGGKLLIFGNGGSAADAQHLAAEFVNRFILDRPPLPALALTTDSSVLTSIGNDFSYDLVFVKQIQALGKPEDVALGISTSGTSANVVQALAVAREMGLTTAGLSGGMTIPENGISQHCDFLLNVSAESTARIQETHLWVEHLLCEIVEKTMFTDQKTA